MAQNDNPGAAAAKNHHSATHAEHKEELHAHHSVLHHGHKDHHDGPTTQRSYDPKKCAVACGKATRILMKMEAKGTCQVVQGSVYGAAVCMPQIARSSGWSGTFTALAFRSVLFLVINVVIQFSLLCMIGESDHQMAAYAGKMHLCDMGRNMQDCPDGSNCEGPGGTKLTFPRLYDFNTWSTRVFARDTLKSMFPDKHKDIEKFADPGEYALEDYTCRIVCVFLLMVGVVGDLYSSIGLARLTLMVPTNEDSWVIDNSPDWASKEEVEKMTGKSEIDFIKFRVAGIPMRWKIFNIMAVLLPKLIIWVSLVLRGVHFVMETAGITDVIMSALAMTFFLSISQILYEALTTRGTKYIVGNIQGFDLFDMHEEGTETDETTLSRYQSEELDMGPRIKQILKLVFPRRLIVICVLMTIFIVKYYYWNCLEAEDGSWFSKDLFYPEKHIHPLGALFGWYAPPPEDSEPIWKMPET